VVVDIIEAKKRLSVKELMLMGKLMLLTPVRDTRHRFHTDSSIPMSWLDSLPAMAETFL